MSDSAAIARRFLDSLGGSRRETVPYRHWFLTGALPTDTCGEIVSLPFAPPPVRETYGKRATNNDKRCYFNSENRCLFEVCDQVARAFQSPLVTRALEAECDISLTGSSLRIEYCQDIDGFWLEPHTDIGVKRFTMLIYLSSGPESETWGTDVLDADHRIVKTARSDFNSGLIFIPAGDTWHSFHKRPINGVRKTIIVNYVEPEWQARHELAFPETPIA